MGARDESAEVGTRNEWHRSADRRHQADRTAPHAHADEGAPMGGSPMTVRPMRGQVVLRDVKPALSSVVWAPDGNPRQVKTHRGKVLALGAPPRTKAGVDVPWSFAVGDEVVYHFAHHERSFTVSWPEDGEPAIWVPAECVDAVVMARAAYEELVYGVDMASPA